MIFSKHNGYSPDGRRLCHKGVDGGASAMRRQEEERQAMDQRGYQRLSMIFSIRQSTSRHQWRRAEFDPDKTYYNKDGSVFDGRKKFNVNSSSGNAFNQIVGNIVDQVGQTSGSASAWDMDKINKAIANGELFTGVETVKPENKREKLYDEQRQAVYDINAKDVNRQYGDAEKANRFGLARNGLMGGSADVDSNARLQEMTNEGLVKAGGIADNASSSLRSADESARQSLIAMAQSGIDTGTAQQMAQQQLESSSQRAQGERSGASIGNLFGGLSQAYLRGNTNQNTTQNVVNNGYNGGNSVRKTYSGS